MPRPASRRSPRFVGAEELAATLSVGEAADALEAALLAGCDPEAELPRSTVEAGPGELLVMPAVVGRYATVKVAGVGGEPRVQGLCVVVEAATLAPVAVMDGVALTTLRTPATSLLAARRLIAPDARRLLVFGRGAQGRAHAAALEAATSIDEVAFVARDAAPAVVAASVRRADVICCATTAGEPLFDGDLVTDDALVIAVGSHRPTERELDERLVRRCAVVVESRRSALREAGEVVAAGIGAGELTTLAELVTGPALARDRPRLFKSTGMSWEDAVVAGAVLDRVSA